MVREPLHLQIHDVRCRTHRITRCQSFLHQVLSLLGRAHHPVAVSQRLTPQPADDTGEILADSHRLLQARPANTSEHADPISTDLAASAQSPPTARTHNSAAIPSERPAPASSAEAAECDARGMSGVATPDGHSNGTLHVPDGDGPWPGVLVFPDASGARETIRQMGNRLAGIGHVALIPDIYHRAGQRAPFDVATLLTDEPLLLLGARKPTTTGRTLPACRTRTRHRPSRITHWQPAAANPPAARTGSSTWHWVESAIRRSGFSKQRRRAAAESGHIRPFPVTKGLTPSN
jgi:hypothetical protein